MNAALAFGLIGMATWLSPQAPDITGTWTGDGWGMVVLEVDADGKIKGTYNRPDRSGTLRMKWSSREGRFNGTWTIAKDRVGDVSIRLVGDEIRGAWTTTENPGDSGTPRLGDFSWTRVAANDDASTPTSAASKAPPPERLHKITGLTIGHDVRVAYSADGKFIAVANGNPSRIMQVGGGSRVKDRWKPSVQILDAKTGENVATLQLSNDEEDAVIDATERISHFEVKALAFAPDGKRIAVGTSIGQIKLFHTRTGLLILAFDDDTAKRADEKTPKQWHSLKRAMGSVKSLRFSPDGSLLAVCGGSFADFSERFAEFSRMGFRTTGPGRLKVWEVKSGKLKHDLAGHNDHANDIAFSPDGRRLASTGRWNKEGDRFGNGVIIWNPITGTQIHRLIRSNANAGTLSIAFSPDGKRLAMGSQRFGDGDTSTGSVSLVQVSSGVTDWLVTVPGWTSRVTFSPDGTSVAALCGGKSIRFLDVETGMVQQEIVPAAAKANWRWQDFAWAGTNGNLVVGGVDKQQAGGVEVWRVGKDRPDQSKSP